METKTILIDANLGAFCGSLGGTAVFNGHSDVVNANKIYRIIGFDKEKAENIANELMKNYSYLNIKCVDIKDFRYYPAYNGWYIDVREIAKQGYGYSIMGMIQNIPNANMEIMH